MTKIYASDANFILFRIRKAKEIYKTMADRGVVCRYRFSLIDHLQVQFTVLCHLRSCFNPICVLSNADIVILTTSRTRHILLHTLRHTFDHTLYHTLRHTLHHIFYYTLYHTLYHTQSHNERHIHLINHSSSRKRSCDLIQSFSVEALSSTAMTACGSLWGRERKM